MSTTPEPVHESLGLSGDTEAKIRAAVANETPGIRFFVLGSLVNGHVPSFGHYCRYFQLREGQADGYWSLRPRAMELLSGFGIMEGDSAIVHNTAASEA